MGVDILTADGHRVPPPWFVLKLEAFDPNLRVQWGFGLARPWPGWIIERKIPDEMKAKVYQDPKKQANRERFKHQIIVGKNGERIADRQLDFMPDWHFVYAVCDTDGMPVLELGEFVIDYLRKNYNRTLLGHPELARRYVAQDDAEDAARLVKKDEQLLEDVADAVEDNKYQIFHETMARTGQPATVKEGTEL